ncbi:hypothetical protein FDP22_04380 [Paroceanicella profunda]|uniref:Glycine cleavage system protein H n=1 Tax=Paroceanicella profunda TaxID=2579971 RepID=A0A5B8FX57_9RHOB|nr:hypothetical protein [Paroceanicella profunda]QDL91089.1 hypothetical protein FDP22_04380 [Paroceanicella profunda]
MLKDQEFTTPTGERVLFSGNAVRLGAGEAIQAYTGALTHLHVIKNVGDAVLRDEAVIVAEGENGAVELYAPCDGTVVWIDEGLTNLEGWLVEIAPAPADTADAVQA